MTVKLYLAKPALKMSTVITLVSRGDRPRARLRETLLLAQGGGQRGDRGIIGTAMVLDTRHAPDGEIDHFVDSVGALMVDERVDISVDQDHRHRGAQLHSAGHLIAEAVQSLCPALHAVAGHHWPDEARVEFEGDVMVAQDFAVRLEAVLQDLVEAALPVRVVGGPFAARAIRIRKFAYVGCG